MSAESPVYVFTRQLPDGEHHVQVDVGTLSPRACSCPLSQEGIVCRATLEVAVTECVSLAQQRMREAHAAHRAAQNILERVMASATRAERELVGDGLELQPLPAATS